MMALCCGMLRSRKIIRGAPPTIRPQLEINPRAILKTRSLFKPAPKIKPILTKARPQPKQASGEVPAGSRPGTGTSRPTTAADEGDAAGPAPPAPHLADDGLNEFGKARCPHYYSLGGCFMGDSCPTPHDMPPGTSIARFRQMRDKVEAMGMKVDPKLFPEAVMSDVKAKEVAYESAEVARIEQAMQRKRETDRFRALPPHSVKWSEDNRNPNHSSYAAGSKTTSWDEERAEGSWQTLQQRGMQEWDKWGPPSSSTSSRSSKTGSGAGAGSLAIVELE